MKLNHHQTEEIVMALVEMVALFISKAQPYSFFWIFACVTMLA